MTLREALKRDGVKTVYDIFYVVKENGDYYSCKEFVDGKGIVTIPDLFMFDNSETLKRIANCKLATGERSVKPHGVVKDYDVRRMYTGKTYLDLMDGICGGRYHAKVCAVYEMPPLQKAVAFGACSFILIPTMIYNKIKGKDPTKL